MSVMCNGENIYLKNLQINSLILAYSYSGPNSGRFVQQVSLNAGCDVTLSGNYPIQNIFNLTNVTVNNFVVDCKHPDRNVSLSKLSLVIH